MEDSEDRGTGLWPGVLALGFGLAVLYRIVYDLPGENREMGVAVSLAIAIAAVVYANGEWRAPGRAALARSGYFAARGAATWIWFLLGVHYATWWFVWTGGGLESGGTGGKEFAAALSFSQSGYTYREAPSAIGA